MKRNFKRKFKRNFKRKFNFGPGACLGLCCTLILLAGCHRSQQEEIHAALPQPQTTTTTTTTASVTAERIEATVQPTATIPIPAGVWQPLFPGKDEPKTLAVAAFHIEAQPVTQAQFLAFVQSHPQWRRSQVQRIFADEGYLQDWTGDLQPPQGSLHQPVTSISWFAARAYAQSIHRRLPTVAEWESAVQPGSLWEWTEDFNSAMVTGDSRGDSDLERQLFCGLGSTGATDPRDYEAFMRMAMRSSLRADYTVKSLGFRCATDEEPPACCAECVEPTDPSPACCAESTDPSPACCAECVEPADPSPACCSESADPSLACCGKCTDAPPACCSESTTAEAQPGAQSLPQTSLFHLQSNWTNQDNQTLQLKDLQGQVYAVTMVFTHCTYACPLILTELKLLEQKVGGDLHFLLITMDPDRDEPEALKRYAALHGLDAKRWTLLHGDSTSVRELAAVLGISYKKTSTGDFAHSSLIAILDRDGQIAFRQKGLTSDPSATIAAAQACLSRH